MDMTLWIAISVLTAATLVWLLVPFLAGRSRTASRAEYDMQVFRDQLRAVERDVARGVLGEAEAEASRTEIARRLLAAEAAAGSEGAVRTSPRWARIAALALMFVMLAGAFLLYTGSREVVRTAGLNEEEVAALERRLSYDFAIPLPARKIPIKGSLVFDGIGAPYLPDAPLEKRLAGRPSQDALELAAMQNGVPARPELPADMAETEKLVDRLQQILEQRPNDLRGQRLLAGALTGLGRYIEARKAWERVIALAGPEIRAEDHASYAEALILAANGVVSITAERAISDALQLDPSLASARYYAGIALIQSERYRQAYAVWNRLLADSPPDAPWVPTLLSRLRPLARALGRPEPKLAAPAPGPTQEDVREAERLSAEERDARIRSMVEGMAQRLEDEGGSPQEWARLITSLGVLGETERAGKTWTEARQIFADKPDALAIVDRAANSAGLAPPAQE